MKLCLTTVTDTLDHFFLCLNVETRHMNGGNQIHELRKLLLL